MTKKNLIFIFFIMALIVSCSNDIHKDFIGKYEFHSIIDGSQRIMEIYKDGNVFFVKEENKDPIPAETINEGLKINGILISLSSDKNTILFGGNKAQRVNDNYANELVLKHKLEKELCEKLNKESERKSKEITDKDEWNKYVDELQKRRPKNCTLIHDSKRWF